MPEINLEDHSEEVQEILGHIPKWIIRWGISILFIIVAIIFFGSSFIPYPEKTTVPIKITSQNAPATLVAKQASNRIAQWFKKDGETVQKGDVLAVWETNEEYTDILTLQKLLGPKKETPLPLPNELTLPGFQTEIREFNKTLNHLASIQNSQKHFVEIKKIEADIKKKTRAIELSKRQQVIKEREFELLENKFKQDSIYYHDGSYGIVKSEYEAEVLKFLRQKSTFLEYQTSLLDLDESLAALKNQISEIKDDRKDQILTAKSDMNEALFALQQRIDKWKLDNLLVAPTNGKLDRSSFWSENQFIPSGEMLAAVLPKDPERVVCRAIVDANMIGSISKGQSVFLKLDGFNSMEMGSIKGQIESVSNIPFDGKYFVNINLPNGLITMENKTLPLIQEMTGIAEIIISEGTLLDRLVKIGL